MSLCLGVSVPQRHASGLVAEGKPSLERRLAAIIVDDHRPLGVALAEHLAIVGFDTAVVTTAREAMEISALASYDVAFVDLQFPDMSGILAAEELKMLSPGLRVILMTGMANAVDDPRVGTGAVDVLLPKPWKAAELQAVLRCVGKR